MSSLRRLILYTGLCLITACGPGAKPDDGKSTLDREQQALVLLSSGDYAGAAAEYQRLAKSGQRHAEAFLLKAVDAYLKAGQPGDADSVLVQLREDQLTAIQVAERNILMARSALQNNDALTAINKLQTAPPVESPRSLFRMFHETRTSALEQDNQLIQAAEASIELNQYLDTPGELADNQLLIWRLLELSDLKDLQQVYAQAGSNPVAASWIELAIIAKTLVYTPAELQTALSSWAERYPDHPAAAQIIPQITSTAAQAGVKPEQVALLLPFNTQYDDAANVIRDGFLAAWYADTGHRPGVRIYQADAQNIPDIHAQAVAEGADIIVGPLDKEAVSVLITNANIPVQTLALNQVSSAELGSATALGQLPLYQFGLLPEDEARLAARRAWADTHANALVITQDNSWGDRIYTAFSTEWAALGGRIVEHVKMPMNIQDFSSPIKELLNINNSEQRAKQLTATLRRNIIAEPRHRQDADIIFLASTPVIAQQIVPQLRFYRAEDIATYSISSIYTGQYQPEANSDLNNVIFADMPWLLDPVQENSPLQIALNNAWNQSTSAYRRLYAFGIDAYRILPELGRLRAQNGSFPGMTGDLSMDDQGYVQRQPAWARFVNGTPQLVPAPQSVQQ